MSHQNSVPTFPFFLHGGEYNPEQWPEAIWSREVELMRESSVKIATLPVFGCRSLQKTEDEWDFGSGHAIYQGTMLDKAELSDFFGKW